MNRMTKRQVISVIVTNMIANDSRRQAMTPLEQHYATTALYADMKTLAASNGYAGGAFTAIWNAACRIHAINNGVYVPGSEVIA